MDDFTRGYIDGLLNYVEFSNARFTWTDIETKAFLEIRDYCQGWQRENLKEMVDYNPYYVGRGLYLMESHRFVLVKNQQGKLELRK